MSHLVPVPMKKARGTYRKDRDKGSPPQSVAKLVAPPWLNKNGKKIFNTLKKRLEDFNMGSASYTESLALLASRMEEVERYSKILDDDGPVIKNELRSPNDPDLVLKVSYQPHPIINLREKAMVHAHKLLVEFGLTAASIQRIGKPKEQKKKNAFDGF